MVRKDGQLCYDSDSFGQELPDLTDADIQWLNDLSDSEEMAHWQYEPPTQITVMDTFQVDIEEQNLEGTA